MRSLIVEDEAAIRNGLLRHVRWAQYDIEEVRAAGSAEEALEMLEDYRPDLVLSDIRMPGMDGTQLGTALRKRLPDVQIIFISGYTDKEYLQAAISIGVAGYVEKPVDPEELSKVLQKAVQEIRRTRHLKRSILHALIMDPGSWENTEGEELYRHYVMFILRAKSRKVDDFDGIAAELSARLSREYGGDFGQVLSDHITTQYYAILVCHMSPWQEEQIRQVCRGILSYAGEDQNWFVSAGREYAGRDQIPQAYRDAADAQRHLGYKGWNSYALQGEEWTEMRNGIPEDQFHCLYQMLSDNDTENANRLVEEWYQKLTSEHTILSLHSSWIFYNMDRVVSRYCQRNGIDDERFRIEESMGGSGIYGELRSLGLEDPKNQITFEDCKTFEELTSYVKRHIAFVLQSDTKVKSNCQLRAVCDYIHQHLGEHELSLNLLAEQVSLSPAYLSSLFSKNMNCTVGQYVTECRIGRAKELLADPGCKLYEVAERVGYEDPKYFSKTFKKVVGVSPKEYRESL